MGGKLSFAALCCIVGKNKRHANGSPYADLSLFSATLWSGVQRNSQMYVIRDAVLLKLPRQNSLFIARSDMSGFHSTSTRPSDGEYECSGGSRGSIIRGRAKRYPLQHDL